MMDYSIRVRKAIQTIVCIRTKSSVEVWFTAAPIYMQISEVAEEILQCATTISEKVRPKTKYGFVHLYIKLINGIIILFSFSKVSS